MHRAYRVILSSHYNRTTESQLTNGHALFPPQFWNSCIIDTLRQTKSQPLSWSYSKHQYAAIFHLSPPPQLRENGAGSGSGTSATPRCLRRSCWFTPETTHSPEDYGHGHFSTWEQALVTPARKENIREQLFLSSELCESV